MITSDRKCICKICDCGKHKCPHKTNPSAIWGKDICSEYVNQYLSHDACKPQSCKPPNNAVCNVDPLSSATTNRVDYISHDVQPPQKFEKPPYEPPLGPMDTESVYRKEYNEKPHCATRPIKPVHSMLDNGKFDSNTTNRTTYLPWDVSAPDRRAPVKYEPPKDPFTALPNYRTDYIEHNAQKTNSCKPPLTTITSDAPFANTSDYRQNFIAHNVEPRALTNLQPYIKPEAPFDGITTNRHDYVAQDTCKPPSCKPPPHRVSTDQPFCGQTTNRSDFIAHDAHVPEKQEREKYIKPEGDMQLNSTYSSDFINQPNSRVYPIKPPKTAVNNQPFDGNTSYRDNYQNWDQPADIVQHREKYQPPKARFDGQTTSGASYIPHNLEKQASCKPPNVHSDQKPFDGQTSYRTDYIHRDKCPCPAEFLSTNPRSVSPDGYLYDGEDGDGHVHYVKDFARERAIQDCTRIAT